MDNTSGPPAQYLSLDDARRILKNELVASAVVYELMRITGTETPGDLVAAIQFHCDAVEKLRQQAKKTANVIVPGP